jgi:aminopeptidase YwaD
MLFALLLAACNSESSPPPLPTATATSIPIPSPTVFDVGSGLPEADRIIEHVRVLADEIGTRVAGSTQEDATVEYARGLLEEWGYVVEIQDFTTSGGGLQRLSTVTVEQPQQIDMIAVGFFGGPSGQAQALLIDAGTGETEDFPDDAAGAFVLIQREDVPFVEMATRALEAGAAGVIITNREPGRFPGVLDPPIDIITVGISQADGETLRGLLEAGQVEIAVNVQETSTAHNVIARPESGVCRTFNGGHYDSVPWSPGAYDNASGAAIVLELARAASVAGLDGHCFMLWGGEEGGLQGSRFLVSELTDAEVDTLEGVFNYDAAAGPGGPLVNGATALSDRAEELAAELGQDVSVFVLSQNAGSDHLAFLEKGIAALMLTAPDAGTLHTPNDTFANLITTSLQPIADLGFAILQSFDAP